ncbi:MAG: GNAT family N-acetyltransferase [Armatimonadota bacterium]
MIRAFTPEDYEALAALTCAVMPDYPTTGDEIRLHDARQDPKCLSARWVWEEDGRLIGAGKYGQWAWMYHPRKFVLDISVLPERQGQGIGRALYDHVVGALAERNPIVLLANAREDYSRTVRFLQDRGFVAEQREWESRLFMDRYESRGVEEAAAQVRAHGIEIRSLRELQDDPDHERKLYELDWVLLQDVPHTQPLSRTEFEQWRKRFHGDPGLRPDAYIVAVHGDEYVGLTALWGSQGNADLYTGLTGVRREYRRKGIARAMKLRALDYAKRCGCPVVKTWNEQGNEGMLGINIALGFERQPAWIQFARYLQPPEQGEENA